MLSEGDQVAERIGEVRAEQDMQPDPPIIL
jgi:hypothetical protein